MAPPANRHNATETWHRRRTFAQLEAGGHGSVELLEQVENPFAVVLEGLTAQISGLALQGGDRPAVIEAQAKIIAASCRRQIQDQLQIKLKPLAQVPLEGQHPNVGPEPQLPHNDPVGRHSAGHSGRARWRKLRWPEA